MSKLSFKDKHIDISHRKAYALEAFLQACKEGEVAVTRKVVESASADLGLQSKSEILHFLTNGGIQDELTWVNSVAWKNNPNPSVQVMVDAYTFLSDHKRCYFAFMYFELTSSWMLKSLHVSEGSNSIMQAALRKFLLQGEKS
ncbi:MAG: hypothetical protein RBR15_13715 [Sphaerochaeta sp.]|nr:hypothetical protein [Sphaerochaeta sp.]